MPRWRRRGSSVAVLALETSCDETSAAVVRGGRVLSNVVSSQARLHESFKGVVPELASRAHMERLGEVAESALGEAFGPRARLAALPRHVQAVAYTRGPGLAGALLVGKVAAQTLAWAHGLPLLGVNHLEAHALALGLERPLRYPFLGLIVSGGHTELLCARAPGRYRVLGRTRDDAAGEAFDKTAKLLGLSYPGGPSVEKAARAGDPAAIAFPRPLLGGGRDFSFAGLKTAVLYHVQGSGLRPPYPARFVADVCASFQEAVAETLARKTVAAARRLRVSSIVVGGGVAANARLRERLREEAGRDFSVRFPSLALCTDNAAMIGYAACERLRRAGAPALAGPVRPSWPIRSWG